MTSFLAIATTAFLAISTMSSIANASDLGKLVKKVVPGKLYEAQKDFVNQTQENLEKAAKDVTKTIAPPISVALDIVQGDSPKQALKELVRDYKEVLKTAASTPAVIKNGVENLTSVAVEQVAGKGAANALRITMLPNQIVRNLPAAGVDAIFKVSEGKDPALVLGIPLSAAIEQAHTYYASKAKPLTPSIQTLLDLGETFNKQQIDEARYVVDNDGGTIAAIINRLMKELGHNDPKGNHAVTIGNIIVFSKEPSHGIADLYFWAHEMQHTVQYKQWGIPEFASRYTTKHDEVEKDADRAADAVMLSAVELAQVLLAASEK